MDFEPLPRRRDRPRSRSPSPYRPAGAGRSVSPPRNGSTQAGSKQSPRQDESQSKAFIRAERTGWRLEGATQQTNVAELKAIMQDLPDSPSGLEMHEAVEAARRNLETVQYRQSVHAAIAAEGSATLKLNRCSAMQLQDERKWKAVVEALEVGRDAFRQCQEARLRGRDTKLASLVNKVLFKWRQALVAKLSKGLNHQDLPLLAIVVHWAHVANLDESSVPALEKASLYLAQKEALDRALEERTRAVLDWAIDGAEEAGLTHDRCDYLRHVLEISTQQTALMAARWGIFVARLGSSRERLRLAISLGREMGFPRAYLAGAVAALEELEGITVSIAQLSNVTRGKDISQLERVVEQSEAQCQAGPKALRPRSSMAGLLGQVFGEAAEALTMEKRKEAVLDKISTTSAKRATQVIEELPRYIKEAKDLKLSEDAQNAQAVFLKAQADKELRKAVEAKDSRALAFAITEAKQCGVPCEMTDKAHDVLKEMKVLQAFSALLQASFNVGALHEGLEAEIKKTFPQGLSDQSNVAQMLAHVVKIREGLEEQSRFIQRPIFFEPNSDQLTEEELERVKEIAEILQKHPHISVQTVGFSTHSAASSASELSSARASHVMKTLRQLGCVNLVNYKGAGWGKKCSNSSKSVRILCDALAISSELRRSLKATVASFRFSL
eukprot:TRINITY_DN46891_c0_g1_i1.p1 TRINITY_DN46891_c0_g1~~TRINITY_DN46891_c0_g1_i1.p1  ORF type:complete len:669 (-),score=166.46 TRINITY_DN46891_c0_g1_i1:119-2125(-)